MQYPTIGIDTDTVKELFSHRGGRRGRAADQKDQAQAQQAGGLHGHPAGLEGVS